MKKPNKIRVVLVGDDGTGKTTALKAILEKTKPRLDDPNNHLAVAGGSSSKTATSNGTAKKAAKKKEESSSSDDTDDSDEDNLQLVNEINTKLTSLSLNVDEINYDFDIWDSGSENDFKEKRRFVYKRATAVLLFFAIDSKQSLENVMNKWKVELKKMNKKAPVFLVGNKIDLRTDQTVSQIEGNQAALKIGAKLYLECSARTSQGIRELFEAALRPPEKKKCLIS